MSIRFACPSCGKAFAVPAANAGRRGRCGGCHGEFTVPRPEPAEDVTAPAPVSPAPAAPAPDMPADETYALGEDAFGTPAYAPTPGVGAAETIPEPPRPRPRKKKKMAGLASTLDAIEPGQFAHLRRPLIAAGVTVVGLSLLALLVPAVATWVGVVLSLAGGALVLAGWLMGAYIAFTEDFVHGFIFAIIPLYAAYYFVSRWDDTKGALTMLLVGVAVGTTGQWALDYGRSHALAVVPEPAEVSLRPGVLVR